MKRLSPQAYIEGIRAGNRIVLSRAITLVESNRPSDAVLAKEVLAGLDTSSKSLRIGITGSPGVGKSTFIETFGLFLAEQLGKKIAVLAIDPSSQKTGGSILGDKTRMEHLARHPNAYIRPSAAGSTLGGVAKKTREAIILCEAAGFELILVETVGVGQSEIAVKQMTDFFLLLMLAGAGDELQGIKKGIMEMTDAIAITKADGQNVKPANRARGEYTAALHLFPPHESGWIPQVLTCSAQEELGIEKIWETITTFQQKMTERGWIAENRASQNLHWLHETVKEQILGNFYGNDSIKTRLRALEKQVRTGEKTSYAGAQELLEVYGKTS